jgi:trehalose 6-phosphate phosphatase
MAVPLSDAAPLLSLLQRKPFGLLSDVDGTLSPIAATPEAAYVPAEVKLALARLAALGVHVALISGRPLEEVREKFGLEGVAYAGNHGLDLWLEGRREKTPGLAKYEGQALAVEAYLQRFPLVGVRRENKGPILALHYRQAGEPKAARQAILEAIAATPPAAAFRVHEGKRIVELRPPLRTDKGTVVRDLAERLGLRGALCLGDDTTDIDMFAALSELRSDGVLEAICIAVAGEETPKGLLVAADYEVAGPQAVASLLAELVRTLESRS